jgi:hypothetical protein
MVEDNFSKQDRKEAAVMIRQCRAVLMAYLRPNSDMTEEQALQRLAEIISAPEIQEIISFDLSRSCGSLRVREKV